MSWLAALEPPPAVSFVAAVAVLYVALARLITALTVWSSGLDPDSDPDLTTPEDPFRLDSSGVLDATDQRRTAA